LSQQKNSLKSSRCRWRIIVLLVAFAGSALALEIRVFYLQLVNHDFLTAQGDDRHIRTVQISAHRGPIVDRRGELLAVSTPVDSIWANPQELRLSLDRVAELAAALELDADDIARQVTSNLDREFVYLRRHLSPAQAARVLSLGITGVYTQREYRRYYPAGEVAGQVVGFTDIDDKGQEGLELAFDFWLQGETGSKRVVRDQLGRVVGDVELIKASREGHELRTSLDLRIQYLAYRELKRAVLDNRAKGGSVVILDPRTGEVLAMVNQPAFNPNDRQQRDPRTYRNRAVTDIFEPGSAFKPFVVAAALESGRFNADSVIDTSPGYIDVGNERIDDPHNLGRISITTLLAKSSNVGATHLALALDPRQMWGVLSGFGIGRLTEITFPGQSAGVLNEPEHWRPIGQATQSFGYGLSVTALQLVRAYAAIGNGGVLPTVSLLAVDEPARGQRVISKSTAADLLAMLEVVVSAQGSGQRAAVQNFRVAGKTGTAWKSVAGGYATDRYISSFAGLAPATRPELAAVVMIDEPSRDAYYGGDVAAPVFARILNDALRILAIPPDALPEPPIRVLAQATEVEP
jgi:cell division protein FtsI (penicillin-binding protein 3)